MSDTDVPSTEPRPGERPVYWRGLEQLAGAPELAAWVDNEFPDEETDLDVDSVSRRTFLGLMGASLALAGLSSTGCDVMRKPAERILPFSKRPEDSVPGRPIYYATSAVVGGTVLGLLVESQDGRPTKVEGHPRHPMSRGATSTWAQAEVLTLYDPDRSKTPRTQGATATLLQVEDYLAQHFGALAPSGGAGLALLTTWRPSPTFHRLLGELRARFPQATVHVDDAAYRANAAEGARLSGREGQRAVPDLAKAKVILSLDCDFVGTDGDTVRQARDFADGRRITPERDEMSRLYVIEAGFTSTGASADHRMRVRAGRVREIAESLAERLFTAGAPIPSGGEPLAFGLKKRELSEADGAFLDALAEDLAAHHGAAVVVAGERQPAAVHALAHLLNSALGADGSTVTWHRDPFEHGSSLHDLARLLDAGSVSTLVVLGANPVHLAPGGLGFKDLLAKAGTTIHHGIFHDETAAVCQWHLPAAHGLEAWGDFVAVDGTTSLQQPLIAPLFGGLSEIEVLARIVGRPAASGYELVKETWAAHAAGAVDAWRDWLHEGVVPAVSPVALAAATSAKAREAAAPLAREAASTAGDVAAVVSAPALAQAWLPLPPAAAGGDGLEVNFTIDTKVLDGRYANNAWLQELPDPMTKLTWDNAALVSARTAEAAGVSSGDVVEVTLGGRSLEAPLLVVPGTADDVVVLPMGYGRTAAGRVGDGVGFDASAIRSAKSPWFESGAALRPTGRTHRLASTQLHGSLKEPDARPFGLFAMKGKERHAILRQGGIEDYRRDPGMFEGLEVLPAEKVKSLWEQPNVRTGQQWGMTIDLNACIGCNACTIACQAENNIPVVGKERVLKGREMHWIRLDRYFSGEEEDPEAAFQPVPCMQCETAPCEGVCPVAATAHSPDGLNDMAYNRCVGTRYCANNCPYKVRRFNYFNFTKENDALVPLLEMQRNPDVTVRFRGVMEKCTYCVQRINVGRIEAKVSGDGVIPDGRVQTACQQACPSQAIVFGDISDPASAVSQQKSQPRNYSMLREMNTQPRTTYLARLRNPNPKLADSPHGAPAHGPVEHGSGRGEGH